VDFQHDALGQELDDGERRFGDQVRPLFGVDDVVNLAFDDSEMPLGLGRRRRFRGRGLIYRPRRWRHWETVTAADFAVRAPDAARGRKSCLVDRAETEDEDELFHDFGLLRPAVL
jgi:hypothetical protein